MYFNSVLGSFLGPLIASLFLARADCPGGTEAEEAGGCAELNPAAGYCACTAEANSTGTSWFLIMSSLSVVLQLVLFFSFGAMADHGGLRKRLMMVRIPLYLSRGCYGV